MSFFLKYTSLLSKRTKRIEKYCCFDCGDGEGELNVKTKRARKERKD